MAAVIRIEIQTSGGVDSVKKDLSDLSNTAKDSGSGFNALSEIATGAMRAVGEAITGFALKGFSMLAGAVQDGIADAQNNAKIQAQTAAVIKSTGEAAGVTAQHVADYASSLSDAAGKSLFGDDQIQQSTNLLLTFGEIKGATLDAATAISVDMAQAMGGAPKDAAIQLGKALNDPIKGITALTRVGVVFSDEQKAQIKAMQEAGDTAGAQQVILNELNKEFGGSAAAAAKATGGWSEFNGRLGEAKEALGTALLPLLNSFAGVLNDSILPIVEEVAAAFGPLIQYFQAVVEDGDTMNDFLASLPDSWQPIVMTVGNVVAAIQGLLTTFQDTSPMDTFSAATGNLAMFWSTYLKPALDAVWTVLQAQVWPILQDLGTALFPLIGAAIQILAGFWTDVLVPALQTFWTMLTTVVLPVIAALAGWLRDNLPGAIQAVADWLTNTLFPAFHQIYDFIAVNVIPILAQIAEWLITNLPVAIQTVTDIINTVLIPAFNSVWMFIQTYILPIFQTVYDWLFTTIPAGAQQMANIWNTVLLPAINAVWSFINTYIIPLFTALVQVHMAALGLALRTLTAIWSTVLLPALQAVWTFIQNSLGPIINWLTVTILKPFFQILADIYMTVIGSVLPVLTKLSSLVKDEVAHAFNSLNSFAGAAAGGLSKIGSAVQEVIKWISDLAAKLNSISVPDWLQGHSPPPMADWFSYIGEGIKGVNAQLPTLAMNLNAQVGPSGGSIVNTASTRSFTYAPNITSNGGHDMPMDLALATSLAGV